MIEFDRRRALISAAGLVVGGMTTAGLLPEESARAIAGPRDPKSRSFRWSRTPKL